MQIEQISEIPIAYDLDQIEDIELRDIIQSFNQAYPVPEEAIYKAFERKDEIIPILLQLLEDVTNNPESVETGRKDYLAALFLLAVFNKTAVFDYLINIMSRNESTAERLLGDQVIELLPCLLVTTYPGDIQKIKEVIENEQAYIGFRTAALDALNLFVLENALTREEVISFYKKLMSSALVERDPHFAGWLVYNACTLQPNDARNEIIALREKGLLKDQNVINEGEIDAYFLRDRKECYDEIPKTPQLDLFKKATNPEGFIDLIHRFYLTPEEQVILEETIRKLHLYVARKIFKEAEWVENRVLREIILSFNQDHPVPEEAIYKAFEYKEELIPILLELLEKAVEYPETVGEERKDHLIAMFLLAAFKEKKAFDYLIKMTSWDEKTAEELLGDVITEAFPGFLVATYNENRQQIMHLIENEQAYIYFRTGALGALNCLAVEKLVDRNDIMTYYEKLICSPLVENDDYFTGSLAYDACMLQPNIAINGIYSLRDRGLISSDFVSLEDLTRCLVMPLEERDNEIKNEVMHHITYTPDELIKKISWLYREVEEEEEDENNDDEDHSLCKDVCLYTKVASPQRIVVKIGRNDPCHCGSNKKYKKCCLEKR